AETQYEDFWREFGRAMKLGVIEDSSNRMRLAKLLRFKRCGPMVAMRGEV
ncbi:unnamed protein product, partial [Closterium sp. NIES-54]